MHALTLVLFVLTYVGLAVGRMPWFKLDRTGFAILGAVAFLATERMTLSQAKDAIDAPTIVVLSGMMLLSAQYRIAGLHAAIVDRLALTKRPEALLAGVIATTAALSAVLTNDVTCFALTPLLGAALIRARLQPLPYLLAIACASNIGSALTPIGNPQNILIAQRMHLEFLPFVAACAVPVVLSLVVLHFILRRRVSVMPDSEATPETLGERVPLDRLQAAKAIVLTAVAIVLFLTPIPAHLTALGVAGIVLINRRMHARDMLGLVDWQMLALFAGLFTVVRGLELSGWVEAARDALAQGGWELSSPPVLVPLVAVVGNVVGNVPAVMLALPFVESSPQVGRSLALISTFAGNALLMGSVANIIVAEQAQRMGLPFGFRDHLRVGLPVTLVSLAIAAVAMGLSSVA